MDDGNVPNAADEHGKSGVCSSTIRPSEKPIDRNNHSKSKDLIAKITEFVEEIQIRLSITTRSSAIWKWIWTQQ